MKNNNTANFLRIAHHSENLPLLPMWDLKFQSNDLLVRCLRPLITIVILINRRNKLCTSQTMMMAMEDG